jgi:hypothetical protein
VGVFGLVLVPLQQFGGDPEDPFGGRPPLGLVAVEEREVALG